MILRTVLNEESRLQELRIRLSAAASDDLVSGPMAAPQLRTLFIEDSSVLHTEVAVGDSLDSLVRFLNLLTAPFAPQL